ncbi:Thioredoxin-like protein 4A [Hibiscus syriacus]|uniref:Thioredoxin-like protein 4A n=1 Tax=Hibiscus syriacus TaxID=106335 RepID=A0A6A3BA57_HIBSY|nr:Thioredoxin-like protein 4A [Hibiscus syriacus]
MDEVFASVAETRKNFAVIYLVDITEVPVFNTMYELWALKDKQEFIDIIETVYRGARKGRGLVIAPKDYSTKYRY